MVMADKINCLIVEDDLIQREVILGYVKRIPDLHVVASCSSALEANTYLSSSSVSLLFSDIEMEDISGLDFLKTLQSPPLTIFVTSFPHYAVDGFLVDAVDYLVKPVMFDRFLKAVNKAKERLDGRRHEAESIRTQEDHFFIRKEGQYLKLHYDDVVYIAAFGDFVKIFTSTENHLTLVNLKHIEEQLPASIFIRVHRSYLVNVMKIHALDGSEIKADHYAIPLGQSYKDQVYSFVVSKKLVKRFGVDSSEEL